MKRSIGFGIVVLIIATMAFGPASAQDKPDATVSALQTQVAELKATVLARGEKINIQRTQIAELKGRVSELEGLVPTPTPTTPLVFSISGRSTTTTDPYQIEAGIYRVEATVNNLGSFAAFSVKIYDRSGFEDYVFIEGIDERGMWEGSVVYTIPYSGEFFFEISAGDPWTLKMSPL